MKTVTLLALVSLISGCNLLAGIGEPQDPGGSGPDASHDDADASTADEPPSGDEIARAMDGPVGSDAAPSEVGGEVELPSFDAKQDAVADSPVDRGIVPPTGDGGLSTIQFQGSWFTSDQNVDYVDVLIPPSVRENDLMWVSLFTDLRLTTVTTPPGWMLRIERQNSMSDFHSWWFYKIAGADEPMQRRFTFNQPTAMSVAIVVYSGVDTAAPFDRGSAFDTHGSPCVAPAIPVAASSGLLFVASFLHDTAHEWAPLDPMNERAKYDRVYVADYPQASDGGTGARSVACTPDGEGAVFVMGLRPLGL
jgi:hypothetical protein